MATKQVIVIRKDLKMRRGKEIAQACHAAMAFLTRQIQGQPYTPKNYTLFGDRTGHVIYLSEAAKSWIDSNFAKICLQVNSEQELLDIEAKAKESGIECHVVIDSGLTEFHNVPTCTCLALGPDESEKIDAITGHLKLY